jgi:hypothetical protein
MGWRRRFREKREEQKLRGGLITTTVSRKSVQGHICTGDKVVG